MGICMIFLLWYGRKKTYQDAILVPVPKKGDFTKCDNWREVSLLDIMGKILQKRLQELAEGLFV